MERRIGVSRFIMVFGRGRVASRSAPYRDNKKAPRKFGAQTQSGTRLGLKRNENPENNVRFRGNVESDSRGVTILLSSRLLLSAPELRRIMPFWSLPACWRNTEASFLTPDWLAGYTADREFTCTSCGASVTLPRRFLLS